MARLKVYTVDGKYIDYLEKNGIDKILDNKQNKRPYIGIVLQINGYNYFAPLSSPKAKHKTMIEKFDFIKINGGNEGVININNMLPVPSSALNLVDLNLLDINYRNLVKKQLQAIWSMSSKIMKNAKIVYNTKINKPDLALSKRCCDFKKAEKLCDSY